MVCSDGDGFEGESRLVQCEVIQAIRGTAPRWRLRSLESRWFQPRFLWFFGYGQPGQGPPPPPAEPGNDLNAANWGLSPDNEQTGSGPNANAAKAGPAIPALDIANLGQVPI
jgi:hypothetical protein